MAILEQSISKILKMFPMLSVNSKTSDNLSCQMIYLNYITVFKKFFGNQWPNRRQPTVYFSLRGLFIMAEKYHASFRFFLLIYEVGIVGVAWPEVLQIEFGKFS